jgi:hypothetical protein
MEEGTFPTAHQKEPGRQLGTQSELHVEKEEVKANMEI